MAEPPKSDINWAATRKAQQREATIAGLKKLAVVVVLGLLGYFVGYPFYLQFMGANNAAIAVSNMKILAQAARAYATENDDLLPPVGYTEALAGLVREKSKFNCPVTGEPFSLNSKAASLRLTDVGNPDKLVLFYVGSGDQLDFRYERFSAVGFVDGNAKRVEKVDPLVWEPAAANPTGN